MWQRTRTFQSGFRSHSPAGDRTLAPSFHTASLVKQQGGGGREETHSGRTPPHPQGKMSEPNKYKEWILETIDSLRSRKARPDLERICRMVRRRHGSDPDRTRTELEKLIQEQTVLKVSYKGSISYRNAAKVQRKSRKRCEDAPKERSEHLNNNTGDSAHSFTDQEEGEEPSPDLSTQTSACGSCRKLTPDSGPNSGNGRLGCGATTSCAVGSGCEEEKASAPRDEGLQQGVGGCPSTSCGTGAQSTATPSKAGAAGGGTKPDLSGADTQNQSSSGSSGSLSHHQTQKETLSHEPKLRLAGGSGRVNSNPGDRLAASERSLRARGHMMKPLGLKEILGYLSSQERLSDEKLTRGKVKVVMEREVERGRLRRTRHGNITLPLTGMVLGETAPEPPSADRLETSPPQGRKESEPMNAASEKEEEDDSRSSDQEGGPPTVAMTTEPGLLEKAAEDAVMRGALKEESPKQPEEDGEVAGSSGMLVLDFLPEAQALPAEGALLSQPNGAHMEKKVIASNHFPLNSHGERNHMSSSLNNLECKTEVGVSSCMLTPTASPRDSSPSEEHGINDSSVGHLKIEGVEGNPVDWTVSDVVTYFTAAGFSEQAAAFKAQEIDGKSLLLMQRNDVLTGLSIKLGPALKIYERHVKVLQKTHFEDDDC